MGVESYFFHIEGVEGTETALWEGMDALHRLEPYGMMPAGSFLKRLASQCARVVDEKAVVSWLPADGKATVACALSFCNYVRNLPFAFALAKEIGAPYADAHLEIVGKRILLAEMELEDFCAVVDEANALRYREFVRLFGEINRDMTPNAFWENRGRRFLAHRK